MRRIALIFLNFVILGRAHSALGQSDFFSVEQTKQTDPMLESAEEPLNALPAPTPTAEPVDDFFGASQHSVVPEKDLSDVKPSPKKEKSVALSAEEDERAIPIDNIGLIVDADGSEKFQTYLQKLFAITRDRPIMPGIVYLVLSGSDTSRTLNEAYAMISKTINQNVEMNPDEVAHMLTDPNKFQEAMIKMQEQIKPGSDFARRLAAAYSLMPVFEIPPMYPVKKLPTWYLVTPQGQIILEGVDDPSQLITKSGKFVAPLGVTEEKVAPTATPVKSAG